MIVLLDEREKKAFLQGLLAGCSRSAADIFRGLQATSETVSRLAAVLRVYIREKERENEVDLSDCEIIVRHRYPEGVFVDVVDARISADVKQMIRTAGWTVG